MTKSFVLAAASLAAIISYGAALLGSEAGDAARDRPVPGDQAPTTWGTEPGSYLDAVSVKCLLVPSHYCHAVLFADGPATANSSSSHEPGLGLASGPPLSIVSPYSGTFVTFPLR
jgi:hypothetical protein